MARGSRIVVSAQPNGKFDEGIGSGTLYPGMLVEMVPATALVGGRFTFRAASKAKDLLGPVCVVLADDFSGRLATDSIASGQRIRLYWPIAGEDLNLLVENTGGTTPVVAIGDFFDTDGTGKLVAAGGTSLTSPFQAAEAFAGATGDNLVWMRYNGT